MSARSPSAFSTTATLARLTVRRALRDRGTLLVVAIAFIPVVFIAVLGGRWQPDNAWSRVLNVTIVPLFAILPPMVLAPLIAEEASAQTYSYLWSRPIERWSIVFGKALALAPLVLGLFLVSAVLSYLIIFGASGAESSRLTHLGLALVLGTAATGAMSSAIGVFIPKHAVAASAAYLLAIDLPVGGMPFSASNISITHHIREIAGVGDPDAALLTHVIWLVAMSVFAISIMMWRIKRVELAASS